MKLVVEEKIVLRIKHKINSFSVPRIFNSLKETYFSTRNYINSLWHLEVIIENKNRNKNFPYKLFRAKFESTHNVILSIDIVLTPI